MKERDSKKNSNTGLITLVICGVVTIAIIIACIFFPNEVFGIFLK